MLSIGGLGVSDYDSRSDVSRQVAEQKRQQVAQMLTPGFDAEWLPVCFCFAR
eukprot:COSAG02_NODE_52216_length_309_cov_0.738095_1_plen_51_part_10